MTDESNVEAVRSIWRRRTRRLGTGVNVAVAVVLAGVVTLMVNNLASRYYGRWDISQRQYYSLSPKTCLLLGSLPVDVRVIAFFGENQVLFDYVKALLKEYEYEAAKSKPQRLSVEFVDPNRDLARTRELVQAYDVGAANVVVFDAAGRKVYVNAKELAEYSREVDIEQLLAGQPSIDEKTVAFKGEQAFSSAIQSVIQSASPVVYLLVGHGERDLADYSNPSGYASIARIMRRDNMDVKPLLLAEQQGVPSDCSALVIAGPRRTIPKVEADLISQYLAGKGRLLAMLDPGVATGLEGVLRAWGVKLSNDVAVGLTLTGRELVVAEYGDHPLTRPLRGVATMFYTPRALDPESAGDSPEPLPVDRPRVTVLAGSTPQGWRETNVEESPPRFDADRDRRGAAAVAVAVEKGPVGGIDVEIKPTRIVVVGDSFFVSNGALKGGMSGNVSFFMSAMNWLVERPTLMGIEPKPPDELRLDVSAEQMRTAYLIVVLAIPGAVALIGLAVGLRRRR